MGKVTFSNKIDLTVSGIAEVNKVTASNINEVKSSINQAYDDLDSEKATRISEDSLKTDKGSFTGTSEDLDNAIKNAVYDG